MSDVIAPALTPDEWAEHRRNPSVAGDIIGEDEAECISIMALNNDALPSDSPYKITRADVDLLRDYVAAIRALPRQVTRAISLSRGDALAAKLAALLPPE